MKIVMTDELFVTIAQELYYKYRKYANIKMDAECEIHSGNKSIFVSEWNKVQVQCLNHINLMKEFYHEYKNWFTPEYQYIWENIFKQEWKRY